MSGGSRRRCDALQHCHCSAIRPLAGEHLHSQSRRRTYRPSSRLLLGACVIAAAARSCRLVQELPAAEDRLRTPSETWALPWHLRSASNSLRPRHLEQQLRPVSMRAHSCMPRLQSRSAAAHSTSSICWAAGATAGWALAAAAAAAGLASAAGAQAARGAAEGLHRSIAMRSSQLETYADPDAPWDPMWVKGKPPQKLKLPATFEAVTPLRLHMAPSPDADLVPGRVIQKGTRFSVEEAVQWGRFRGQDVIFMKPTRAYFKKEKPLDDEDWGQGGWICDLGTVKGPWFLRKVVKRMRFA
mmetsp:Transcript_67815/g.122185  ORF Transcript_67815/g.122185 Transcript_67815/m.122185 type:complete len:299 (+) Transcript_67815:57-953(+)